MGFFDRFRKKKDQVSPGGSRIYRYQEQEERKLQLPQDCGVYMEEIEAHFAALFPGREGFILHEILSDLVHIDIHVMRPTAEQPFYVVFTTGMSDLPMDIPKDIPAKDRKDLELAELYMFLPGEWDLGGVGTSPKDMDPAHAWPILFMKFLARFPHQYHTWLAYGHTIPNGEGYAPLGEGTTMGGVVLNCGGGGLGSLKAKDGRLIHLYQVLPCYKEEIEYKLKYGMEALISLFRDKKVSPVLDPGRENLCPDFHEVLD